MERIRFGAMCEKLFLRPLCGDAEDILYFSSSQLMSAGLALSGFAAKLSGRAVLVGAEEAEYLESISGDNKKLCDLADSKGSSACVPVGDAGIYDSSNRELTKDSNQDSSNKELIKDSNQDSSNKDCVGDAKSALLKILSRLKTAELIVLTEARLAPLLQKMAEKEGVKAALSLKPAAIATQLPLYIEGRLNTVEMIHGELLDVFGVGILITGESGTGKSETALDLITRGHLLVADDAVAVRREGNVLVGCSPSITRHLMDVRGIGVIDVRAMYGAGAIKTEQEIDIAINLEPYCEDKDYAAEQWLSLGGISLPLISLPLRQGRNISVLIEVAARNLKLRAMGIDAMAELNRRVEKSNEERKNEK